MFPDGRACAAYLERLRWSDGFVCPACRSTAAPWRQTRGRLVCGTCRHQGTVTAGTLLDKTRTPLTTWFEAAWHLTTAKHGLSATTLERTLGTRYRVAWTMRQRFRVAMVRSERERLTGEVEVDEALVGGVEHGGKRGRGPSKSVVVIAVEVLASQGFGRLRMRHVPHASGATLLPFVCDVVAPRLHGAYRRLGRLQQPAQARLHAPDARPVVLHRSRPRGHAGRASNRQPAEAVDPRHAPGLRHSRPPPVLGRGVHLPFNRRASRSRGLVFRRLLEHAVATGPVTEADVTHGYEW